MIINIPEDLLIPLLRIFLINLSTYVNTRCKRLNLENLPNSSVRADLRSLYNLAKHYDVREHRRGHHYRFRGAIDAQVISNSLVHATRCQIPAMLAVQFLREASDFIQQNVMVESLHRKNSKINGLKIDLTLVASLLNKTAAQFQTGERYGL